MNFTNFKYPFLCLFEVEAKKGNFLLFLHRNGQHWQTSVIHENLCVGFPNFKQSLHQQGLAFDPAHKPYQEHFCRVLDKVTYQVTKYLKQHGWKANTVSKAISIASTDGDVSWIRILYALARRLSLHKFNQSVIANLPPIFNRANVSFNFNFTDNHTSDVTNNCKIVMLLTITTLSTTTAWAITPQSTTPRQCNMTQIQTIRAMDKDNIHLQTKKAVNVLFWRQWNEWNLCLHNKPNIFQHN